VFSAERRSAGSTFRQAVSQCGTSTGTLLPQQVCCGYWCMLKLFCKMSCVHLHRNHLCYKQHTCKGCTPEHVVHQVPCAQRRAISSTATLCVPQTVCQWQQQ
jgi:hypothetical protein